MLWIDLYNFLLDAFFSCYLSFIFQLLLYFLILLIYNAITINSYNFANLGKRFNADRR